MPEVEDEEIAEGTLGGKCLSGSLSAAQHWSLLQREEYKFLEAPGSLQSALMSGLELCICTHAEVTLTAWVADVEF